LADEGGRPVVSIVIPVHNEQDNLPQLIQELKQALCASSVRTEVLLVDDASTDASREVIEREITGTPAFELLGLEERGGQTGCFQAGFAAARGEYIIRMDSDLQDDPADLAKFFDTICEHRPDLIMGLREMRRHRRLLRIVTTLYDTFIMVFFDSPLYTNSSSFVAFRAEFVKGTRFVKNDHRYLPLIAMRRGAANLRQVVVRHRARRHGQSKYRIYRKVLFGFFEVLGFLARLRLGYYAKERNLH
jgi:glycosyltransferase involved in cell wall biosynthesis